MRLEMTRIALYRLSFVVMVALLWLAIPGAFASADQPAEEKHAWSGWIDEAGFIVGYAKATDDGGTDKTLLIAHIGKDINRFIPALKNDRGTLSFFLEPQVNSLLGPSSEIEFGLGVGLQYTHPINETISPYILAMTGPHYLPVETSTQANGFNFASAIGAGIYLSLAKTVALNVGYRLRHISNAGTQKPNGGINSGISLVGLSFFF